MWTYWHGLKMGNNMVIHFIETKEKGIMNKGNYEEKVLKNESANKY